MTLEAYNTLFAGLTFAVIAATAIAATVQLRHMRASNQMSALIAVLEDWKTPELQAWTRFVRNDLSEKLRDPAFVADLTERRPDRTIHLELQLCDYFEQIGSYFKYGLLDLRSYLDVSAFTVQDLYARVQPVIEKMREKRGISLYENFEYLAVQGALWVQRNPGGTYPPGLPRFNDLKRRSDSTAGGS